MNRLVDKQVIEVILSDVGAGIVITLVDTYHPAQRTILRCKEIAILQWHRSPPDDPPYIIPELYWREVGLEAIRDLLIQLRYCFSDDLGSSMLGQSVLPAAEAVWCRFDRPLIHLHLEGAICADIICAGLEIQSCEPTEAKGAG
jgi:hypothetical protein